jgi:hypothetical protein
VIGHRVRVRVMGTLSASAPGGSGRATQRATSCTGARGTHSGCEQSTRTIQGWGTQLRPGRRAARPAAARGGAGRVKRASGQIGLRGATLSREGRIGSWKSALDSARRRRTSAPGAPRGRRSRLSEGEHAAGRSGRGRGRESTPRWRAGSSSGDTGSSWQPRPHGALRRRGASGPGRSHPGIRRGAVLGGCTARGVRSGGAHPMNCTRSSTSRMAPSSAPSGASPSRSKKGESSAMAVKRSSGARPLSCARTASFQPSSPAASSHVSGWVPASAASCANSSAKPRDLRQPSRRRAHPAAGSRPGALARLPSRGASTRRSVAMVGARCAPCWSNDGLGDAARQLCMRSLARGSCNLARSPPLAMW